MGRCFLEGYMVYEESGTLSASSVVRKEKGDLVLVLESLRQGLCPV